MNTAEFFAWICTHALAIYKNWIVYVQYEHGWINLLKPQALFVVVVLISYHYNTVE